MSREKYIINIDTNKQEFIELIYYDGSKLQINLENKSILAWYNYNNDYEEWYYIKLKQKSFISYISNKMSLFDILNREQVYSVKRYYNNYNKLEELVELNSSTLSQYILPTIDSFLDFNFRKESEYLNYMFKDYMLKDIYSSQDNKVEHTTQNNELDYINYKKSGNNYEVA